MRIVRINYGNLVRQLLPVHKRQPERLRWLRGLTSPLEGLFSDFGAWRDNVRMTANVTSQVMVLEGYLRKKYAEPLAIRIETYQDGGQMVCLEEEGQAQRLDLALGGAEDVPSAAIPLEGEIRRQLDGASFIVRIPAGVDSDAVKADIERFKQAMVTYKIIQN